MTKITSTI